MQVLAEFIRNRHLYLLPEDAEACLDIVETLMPLQIATKRVSIPCQRFCNTIILSLFCVMRIAPRIFPDREETGNTGKYKTQDSRWQI